MRPYAFPQPKFASHDLAHAPRAARGAPQEARPLPGCRVLCWLGGPRGGGARCAAPWAPSPRPFRPPGGSPRPSNAQLAAPRAGTGPDGPRWRPSPARRAYVPARAAAAIARRGAALFAPGAAAAAGDSARKAVGGAPERRRRRRQAAMRGCTRVTPRRAAIWQSGNTKARPSRR